MEITSEANYRETPTVILQDSDGPYNAAAGGSGQAAGCLRPGVHLILRLSQVCLRPGVHLSLCRSQVCSLCNVASELLALNKYLWS